MSSLVVQFRGGLYCPQLDLWMDPELPQLGPEKVFVSHAHSDHIAAHREVILTAPTARFLQERIPGTRIEHVLGFGEARPFQGLDSNWQITLLPAGHIFGSAMALLEYGGESLLYTGDFKLKPGLSAEKCEPHHANVLVMETTFGRPRYVFPPVRQVLHSILNFCREALENDEVPVLLGYSLGKSQELLCCLGEAGLPIVLHGSVYRLTQMYAELGHCFPAYESYRPGATRGKVLLCPPNVAGSAMLRNLGRHRTAILTGWAVDPNCRYRYQCDAAFPLSDHADFPDLLELVKQVSPKKVYTLHGFAADFAQTLREIGIDAQSLSQTDQLSLAFHTSSATRSTNVPGLSASHAAAGSTSPIQSPEPDSFLLFARTCDGVAADARKLEKIRILSEYLHGLRGKTLELAVTWFTGKPFPSNQNKVLQLGWALIRDALCATGNTDPNSFHQVYLKHSDLGETAAEVLQNQTTPATLSVGDVGDVFNQLAAVRGPIAKRPILRDVLLRSSPIEAKYLIKIITGDLRIGLKEGLVEEAVAQAFEQAPEEIRRANLLIGEIGRTATLASEHRLGEAQLLPFRPIKFMLASPEETAADIWRRVQENAEAPPSNQESNGSEAPVPGPAGQLPSHTFPGLSAWVEDKYDGVRCQLHKVGSRVGLYSRDLKDITTMFLEIADPVSRAVRDFILDGEVVPMRGEQVLPFSELQKRLGRRQGDLFLTDEVPIRFVAFDCLWLDGGSLLDRPLQDRRAALESLAPYPGCLRLAQASRVRSAEELDLAFDAARQRGNEGLLIKDPLSPYAPGRRGLAWLKLKKALATLDCVVVGAEYGHGKRRAVLSDYTFAVLDESSGELKTIGKAYTGLTDVEIATLTEHFLKTATRRQGRYFEVPPDTVLEIAFDRLQRSTRHSSGLAMRFPRIVRIRSDKSAADIDTLATALRWVSELTRPQQPV